ncbi:unnamed protein product [Triticum turgidum subsp. durum]|uniref:DUF642 domain-containing protein n=1 Tax=Triticum turgidum subsp. durum TaxID=4567 RepID=A0A9R1PTP6_TRITD|nr:unnamed protein product [Triticum turgidum subsp. durum]
MATSMRWIAFFLLVVLSALAVSAVIEDGLLPNGDFRNGPDKSQMKGPVVTGKYAIPNWELSGFVEYIDSGHTQDDMILPVPEEKLNVSVDPEFGVLPIQTVYTNTGWDTYSWAFKPRHSTVWLSIHNTGIEENPACGPLIIAVAIKTLYPQLYNKGNMVKNGDFEQGPYIFSNTPWGALLPPILEDVHSPLPGWMIMSGTKVVKYIDAQHHAVPKGARAVELVAGVEVALVQEVPGTVPGRSYRLSFSIGDARNGCVGSLGVDVYAARERRRVSYESRGTGGHKCAKLEFTAIANKTRVVFQSSNHHTVNATLCGPVVDDVWLVRLK